MKRVQKTFARLISFDCIAKRQEGLGCEKKRSSGEVFREADFFIALSPDYAREFSR